MTTTHLRIRGLTKSFGGVKALDGVDLTVPAGQVHALLGHNGAGKSTLIKCLGGAFPPDAGTIEVGGTSYTRLTPRESIAAGVAIIFQTLSVIDALTVAENIFLGQEWTRHGRIDRRAQEEVAAGLLERVAARCSPRDRVADLPMAQRQLVEIAKALSRSASVLVLDEPTAALSGTETDALAERVEDLRTQGLAIVYVTHLLAEVERLADAVTVLRDGRVAHQGAAAGRTRGDLVAAIAGSPTQTTPGPRRATGREVEEPGYGQGRDVRGAGRGQARDAQEPPCRPGSEARGSQPRPDLDAPESRSGPGLDTSHSQPRSGPDVRGSSACGSGADVRDPGRRLGPAGREPRCTPGRDERHPACVPGPDTPGSPRTQAPPRLTVEALRGPGFGPVGLTVAEGERVGLFGLIGSGRTRILETLYGRRRATAGTIRVGDNSVAPARPADALGAGIALVPADRRAQGLFPSLSAQDNALLPSIRPLSRHGVRALRSERRVFDALATAVGLRPARPGLAAGAFSGGNQQKLVLGRWINEARHVEVLLLDEPTQGVDVGARQEIYRVVNGLAAERGTAVLFASSDPEEIVALADRCLIVARGRVVGELSGTELTEQALLSAVHDPDSPTAEGAA